MCDEAFRQICNTDNSPKVFVKMIEEVEKVLYVCKNEKIHY